MTTVTAYQVYTDYEYGALASSRGIVGHSHSGNMYFIKRGLTSCSLSFGDKDTLFGPAGTLPSSSATSSSVGNGVYGSVDVIG